MTRTVTVVRHDARGFFTSHTTTTDQLEEDYIMKMRGKHPGSPQSTSAWDLLEQDIRSDSFLESNVKDNLLYNLERIRTHGE